MVIEEYAEFDEFVIALLRCAPQTAYRIGKAIGKDKQAGFVILCRLKDKGLVDWRMDATAATYRTPPAKKDTSPFPKPSWKTPNVGWIG